MKKSKAIIIFITSVLFIMAILYIKTYLIATGVGMILGIDVKLIPVLLIVLALEIGGSSKWY